VRFTGVDAQAGLALDRALDDLALIGLIDPAK
jgi:hypothetical protein